LGGCGSSPSSSLSNALRSRLQPTRELGQKERRNLGWRPSRHFSTAGEVGRTGTSSSSTSLPGSTSFQTDSTAGEVETSQEGLRRARSDLLDSWADPNTTVYANPICSQMDQLLLKCPEHEDVLALLVTHRGVFFVHNLVTAVQVLGALAADGSIEKMALNAMLQDPRYDLLIRDLIRFVPKLDFLAMANIACSLRQLGHKHYVLLSRMLTPLLRQPAPDVTTLIRCIKAYTWAGYTAQDDFYAHFAGVLAERIEELNPAQIVDACRLFGDAAQYQVKFFVAAEEALLTSGMLEEDMEPHEVAIIAKAFSSHLRTNHDALFDAIARVLERDASKMQVQDISSVLSSFRRLALKYDAALEAGLLGVAPALWEAWVLRKPLDDVKPSDVATIIEAAAFFGVKSDDLLRPAMDYLDDRVDEVGEQSAINVVYAMCLTGAISTHGRLLLYLFRKIGAGTAWEKHKVRVFQLWLAQQLQFPWLDAKLRRRCVEGGLRAYVLHRRGFGCPFPDNAREVAAELTELGIPCRLFVPVPDTPYEVDVVVGDRKDALLISSEVSRNTMQPVGGTLLEMQHLKARGWRCVVVPRRLWMSLESAPQGSRKQYLEGLLSAFKLPSGQ